MPSSCKRWWMPRFDRLLGIHVLVVVRIIKIECRLEDERGFTVLLEMRALETRRRLPFDGLTHDHDISRQ